MASSKILSIECATDLCSVALLGAGDPRRTEDKTRDKHSETLIPMVQQLLRDADIQPTELTLLAAGIGPGSFTGVRTAVSVAQGLALGWNLPLMGVCTLDALALTAAQPGKRRVLAIIDARMQEVYASVMDVQGDTATQVQPPVVIAPHLLADWLNEPVDVVAGYGLDSYAAYIQKLGVPVITANADALQVARIARSRFVPGSQYQPEDCQPLYVRNDVALTIAQRALVGQAA
ncbi:MAG: tRNA (adenosine(37)-N6)-threonylcarbamoyltransferase complex dimerization subunit type 1 TsaB [Burkholderiaceae bacterium]